MRKLSREKINNYFPEITEDVYVLTDAEIRILKERSALSGLPGNSEIKREITNSFINGPADNIIAYYDLNHFKAYNDNYGFIKGDKVIKLVAEKMKKINKGFTGHIGGDDFVGIMKEEDFDSFARELLEYFDDKNREFYDAVDYERGCIISFDRDGNRNTFPLMGGTVVAFKNGGRFITPESVGEFAAQLKNVAKLKADYFIGSSIVFKSDGDDITPLKSMIMNKRIPLNMRRGAIEALGELKDTSYEGIILEILKSNQSDNLIKKSALFALGKLRVKEMLPEIRYYLNNPSAHLRMRAVEALGEIGVPDEAIARAFEDKDYYVRQAAVIAAGKTSDPQYIPHLKNISKDNRLKHYVFLSLAALGDSDTKAYLSAFAKSNRVRLDMRIIALKLLAADVKNISQGDIKTILENIESEPPDYIVGALHVAAKSGQNLLEHITPSEISIIFKLSEHSSWRVRRAFCEFAAAVGGDEARDRIHQLCFDFNTGVRVKAVEVLAAFPGSYQFVTKFFNNNNELLRAVAVSTVKDMDIPEKPLIKIIEKLRLKLKDPYHEVCEKAAESILFLLRKHN